MSPQDQLLLFIAAKDDAVDPIRIMKGMFLFSRNVADGKVTGVESSFEFRPMNFGPCSPSIYTELQTLAEAGLITCSPVPGETWSRYQITPGGKRNAILVKMHSPVNAYTFISTLRTWCDQQTFTSLLQSVYHAYPSYAVNSVLPHLRPNG